MKGNLISLISVIFILLAGMAMTGCVTTTARTPLMQAVEQSDSNAIRALLDKGADINEQSDYDIGPGGKGWTALHLAAVKDDIKVIRLLLDYGADPGITTKFGWTPLKWAEQKGNNFVAGMLKEAMEKRYVVDKKPTHITTEKPLKSDVDELLIFVNEHKVIGDQDIAIVIGIEKYQNIPKSDYSAGDAKLVKSYFKALGFAERNIEFITDERATKSSIEKSIEAWLPNRVKKDSKVIVYYSGHGAPEPKTGDAYIVPFDGDPNYLEVTGYPLKRLYDKLGKLQVAEVVVLLDSCFSGAGGRSVLAKGARPLVMMTEASVISSNMAILSATQGTQISTSSPEKRHGVFTYYFLKALKEGKKTIAEIYEYIKPLVEDEAKTLNVQQSPSISPDAEKLKGRFILRR